MALIEEEDRKQLADLFEHMLARKVRLAFFTKAEKCENCEKTREILAETAAISDKIELVVLDFEQDGPKYGIARAPGIAVLVGDGEDLGIRLYGAPDGYEFTSLVEALITAGSTEVELEAETKKILEKIDRPVHIEALVLTTCPACPEAVKLAHKFAAAHPRITADMVEVRDFPEIGEKYDVSSVPKVVINAEAEFVGVVPESEFAELLLKAIHPELFEDNKPNEQ